MTSQVTFVFAGDTKQLEKSTDKAVTSAEKMAQGVTKSSEKVDKGFGRVAAGAAFLTSGLSNLGDSISQITDLSRDGAMRADRLARAQADVAQSALDIEQAYRDATQATIDFQQSQRDAAQAALDVEQAQIDADSAARDYAQAVAEFGANSIEARQALLDQKQAQEDLKQAQLDSQQATEDGNQALMDGKQAAVDAASATVDLSEAQRELTDAGSSVKTWVDRLNAVSPVIMTAVGAMTLLKDTTLAANIATKAATAAQWLWNAAQAASPIGLIVLGIAALIAIVVLLIKHWDDVKEAAGKAWDWIKDKASGVWEWIKTLPDKFKSMGQDLINVILWPYKTAFNLIADAWNKTIGKLKWTVPDWVPFIGGKTVGAPQLPKFHDGGLVPGAPGTEMVALLQAGERVTPVGQSGSEPQAIVITFKGSMVEALRPEVISRGGNVQVVLGR